MKKNIFIAITSLVFISRFFLFIQTQDVGIEHDSGWYLGVARSVAERGIYASYTNTVGSSEKPGSFPSIHGRFSAQDKNGFVYFPAGVTVGPGYVFPQALLLKIFGFGWVQYRLWPFIAFCLLIPLLFYIVLSIGSLPSLLFFQMWLWLYPQILLNQSYEALSEHIALLFLLSGYLLFQKALSPHSKKTFYFALAGLLLGLSFQTKNLYLLGIIFTAGWMVYKTIKKKVQLQHCVVFFIFLIAPTLLFELYRFIVLYSQFGFMGYWQNIIDIKRTLQSGGSGMSIFKSGLDFKFAYNKLSVWLHIGAPSFLFFLPLLVVLMVSKKKFSLLFWNLIFSSLLFFAWFILLSPTGWFRHIFPAILMGMILVSELTITMITSLFKEKNERWLALISLLLILSLMGMFLSNTSIAGFAITKDEMIKIYKSPSPNGLQGPLSHPIFSKKDQDEITSFIINNISSKTKICFYKQQLVAEIPPLVDRVFYPLSRCGEDDIFIIGPYQKGIYAQEKFNPAEIIKNKCKKTVFSNEDYELCTIQKTSNK